MDTEAPEARAREFFLGCVERLPNRAFILGGSGWSTDPLPDNVRPLGHVPTTMHNALNSSSLAVLNISCESTAANRFSPATRVSETAARERVLAEHTYVQRADLVEQVFTAALTHAGGLEGVR